MILIKARIDYQNNIITKYESQFVNKMFYPDRLLHHRCSLNCKHMYNLLPCWSRLHNQFDNCYHQFDIHRYLDR